MTRVLTLPPGDGVPRLSRQTERHPGRLHQRAERFGPGGVLRREVEKVSVEDAKNGP